MFVAVSLAFWLTIVAGTSGLVFCFYGVSRLPLSLVARVVFAILGLGVFVALAGWGLAAATALLQ